MEDLTQLEWQKRSFDTSAISGARYVYTDAVQQEAKWKFFHVHLNTPYHFIRMNCKGQRWTAHYITLKKLFDDARLLAFVFLLDWK